MLRYLMLGCIAFLLSGCAVAPPKLDPKLHPPHMADLLQSAASASECEQPAVARLRFSAAFKYGCFCGKGHPRFTSPEALSDTKEQRIQRYFSIRPIDSLDEACRDHDVCWQMRGEGDGMCNEELYKRLQYIYSEMDRDAPVDSLPWRCKILASDMASVFLTLFVEDNWEDAAIQMGSRVGRLFSTSFSWVLLALRFPIWSDDPYPFAMERCNVPALEVKAE